MGRAHTVLAWSANQKNLRRTSSPSEHVSSDFAPQIRCRLLLSSILEDINKWSRVCELSGEDAQAVVDYLDIAARKGDDTHNDRESRRALALLCKVAKSVQIYPRRYELTGVQYDNLPVSGGGFADVYKGTHEGRLVCVKAFLGYQKPEGNNRMIRMIARELVLWAHLSHPNVLPFYGVYLSGPAPSRVCLISPWMENGNLRIYLQKSPEISRMPFIIDVLGGLSYLHGLGIVHSDLKAENVLVSNDRRALIADFGVSSIAATTKLRFVTSNGGTPRWMAPELLSADGDVRITKACDIWSFGCLCYEILTNRQPFHQYNHYQVLYALVREEIPLRPKLDDSDFEEINDNLWSLLAQCWHYVPDDRPCCEEIQDAITEMGLHRGMDAITLKTSPALCETKREPLFNVDYVRLEELLSNLFSRNDSTCPSLANDPPEKQSWRNWFTNLGNSRSATWSPLNKLFNKLFNKLQWGVQRKTLRNIALPQDSCNATIAVQSSPGTIQSRCYSLLSGVLRGDNLLTRVHEASRSDAQLIVDFLDAVLREVSVLERDERDRALFLLCAQAKSSGVYPRCYELKGVEYRDEVMGGGPLANVYKGKQGDQLICLKVLRIFREQEIHHFLRDHVKELATCSYLRQDNILPFYGAYFLSLAPSRLCFVSPWMDNGNIQHYLTEHLEAPRMLFISDIVEGLRYLHSVGIVHGDLKAENVLISEDKRALITDFGMPYTAGTTGLGLTTNLDHIRGMAPELLRGGPVQATKPCDIWSFACLSYEILTNMRPFYQYQTMQLVVALTRKEIPLRPRRGGSGEIKDQMWSLLMDCWSYSPPNRPSCETIRGAITKMKIQDDRPKAVTAVQTSYAFWEASRKRSDDGIDYARVEELLFDAQS